MSSTACYRLTFLGTPCAECKGESLPPFARRPTWAMLALLAERNNFVSRDDLGQFWNDEGGGLRQALHACYKTFGQDAFEKSGRAVRLREGMFATDTAQFLCYVRESDRTANETQRIEKLHDALTLVRGAFLAGCEDGATGWVSMQQSLWQARIAAAGRTLLELLEAQSRPREALEVAERLAALLPDEPDFPQMMNFQGRLARPDGTPVADGTYSLTFKLFTTATGGTRVWQHTLPAVIVHNGVFSVLLNGPYRSVLEEYVLSERALHRGLFHADMVRELVTRHLAGENHTERLWSLVNFEVWLRQFIDGEASDTPGREQVFAAR